MSTMSTKYSKPEIKTLSVGEILETLGPVSCGSGAVLGGGSTLEPSVRGGGAGSSKSWN